MKHLPELNKFLNDVNGVIHIGASDGQEREFYDKHGLNVVWIEPIPRVFANLQKNLKKYPQQKGYQYLITDQDGVEYSFGVSNNNGESSSIFELKLHKKLHRNVRYTHYIQLKSTTLQTFVEKENIDINQHNALIMDTQGSELLVIKGASKILDQFKYIKAEAWGMEAYEGCCLADDLVREITSYGFEETYRETYYAKSNIGNGYDIVFRRIDN